MRPGLAVWVTAIDVPPTTHVEVVAVAAGTSRMSELLPVMLCKVNFGEKYVIAMEVLRRMEPLRPRKYAEVAEGPIEGGIIMLFDTADGEVLERFHA